MHLWGQVWKLISMRSPTTLYPTLFVSLALLLPACAIGAENKAPLPQGSFLTLERLHASDEFRTGSFGPARWLDDDAGNIVICL